MNQVSIPETYVYQDGEVKLTGRVARRPGPGSKVQELVEITPANPDDGSWKRWIPMSTLYKVQNSVHT